MKGAKVSMRRAKVSCRDDFTFSAPTLRSLLLGTEIGFIILPALTETAGLTSVLQQQIKAPKNKRRRKQLIIVAKCFAVNV